MPFLAAKDKNFRLRFTRIVSYEKLVRGPCNIRIIGPYFQCSIALKNECISSNILVSKEHLFITISNCFLSLFLVFSFFFLYRLKYQYQSKHAKRSQHNRFISVFYLVRFKRYSYQFNGRYSTILTSLVLGLECGLSKLVGWGAKMGYQQYYMNMTLNYTYS